MQQCAYLQLIWTSQPVIVILLLILPACVSCREPAGRRLQDYVSRSIARSAKLGKHTLVTQAAQENLPIGESHPHIVHTGAAGFAKGCCTYSERYDVYKDFTKLRGASWNPNIEIPDSNYTVIMRVHHGLKWSEDLRLSVRAMMTECRRAGLHFWLLHQDTSANASDSNARPTNFILDCPEEVRSIVRTFTAATVHGAYPLLHKFDDPHSRDYLTYLTFLRRQYVDILHELSVEGNGGYVEDFVATVAVEENLSIVSMPHAEYGGYSFHCCIPDGTQYYTDWYLTGECRNFALNHPVKNDNESIWGKTQEYFDA
ncbi:hypothetical protein WJX79_000493 [Trebouxia sp. C0005]